jgi:hypothetical protein
MSQTETTHETTREAPTRSFGVQRLIMARRDREWMDYPIGTKAHAINGGYWERVERGWKWCTGATFPTPGGDAVGACIEMPQDVYYVDCCNEECGWRGLTSDCKMLGDIGQLCPECGETTEPAQAEPW